MGSFEEELVREAIRQGIQPMAGAAAVSRSVKRDDSGKVVSVTDTYTLDGPLEYIVLDLTL